MQSVIKRCGLWVLLLGISVFSACGEGISKKITRPVQMPPDVPVSVVTALASQSLGSLRYTVVENDPVRGRVSAARPVPGDMYNRVTRMKVDVTPRAAGELMLDIEAFSCPGCVPEAIFDPVFMINEFNIVFDAQARDAGLLGQSTDRQWAQTRQLSRDEQKSMETAVADGQRKVYLGVTIQDVTPETASMAGMVQPRGVLIQNVLPGSPAEKADLRQGDIILEADGSAVQDSRDVILKVSKKKPGQTMRILVWRNGKSLRKGAVLALRPDEEEYAAMPGPAGKAATGGARSAEAVQRPSLKIQKIEVVPIRVRAGADFDLKVEYTASDPSAGAGEIPVQFSYSILEKGKALYSQPEVSLNAPNGTATGRVEHLKASTRRGTYSIKAVLRYRGSAVEESIDFTIE